MAAEQVRRAELCHLPPHFCSWRSTWKDAAVAALADGLDAVLDEDGDQAARHAGHVALAENRLARQVEPVVEVVGQLDAKAQRVVAHEHRLGIVRKGMPPVTRRSAAMGDGRRTMHGTGRVTTKKEKNEKKTLPQASPAPWLHRAAQYSRKTYVTSPSATASLKVASSASVGQCKP